MTSAEAKCPQCGHSPTKHRQGQCLAIVKLKNPPSIPAKGEHTKAHCGCTYYQPQAVEWGA